MRATPGVAVNAFRTPSLRGVALTGPWLHDGSAARLCDAVQPHAADGDVAPPLLDARERGELVAFLRSLSTTPPSAETTSDCR